MGRRVSMGQRENVKISVIVTIHNAEKYIRECINSVLCQTFGDIEILCMDGGSTDSTPEILQKYAEEDKRIRIINDPDTSYGHKVNRGIREAGGEYISVLESDDMYEPFMLEKLYETAERYHPDFVNADYTNFFDINGKRFYYVTKMYREGDYNCLIDYKKHPERFDSIPRYWTGLFLKEYLLREDIKMNESKGASFQDMSFRFLTSVLAGRAYHLDIPVYLYRIDNPDSSVYDSKKTIVIAEEHEFLQKELQRRNITNHDIWRNAYQWKYTDFRGNMRHLKGEYRQELFERYLEELEKDRVSLALYGKPEYNLFALEMMTEPPVRVAELIEEDAVKEDRERKQLYQFLYKIGSLNEKQKIVIFGCGQRGEAVLKLIRCVDDQIGCLTDNLQALWNTDKWNHTILPPECAIEQYPDAFYIVANKYHAEEMAKQLRDNGIREEMICIYKNSTEKAG